MIMVGDYIDSTIGIAFHISVLAAAALGNTVSDLVGIFFGGYVELVADRCGLPQPKFSAQEADSLHARVAKNTGQGRVKNFFSKKSVFGWSENLEKLWLHKLFFSNDDLYIILKHENWVFRKIRVFQFKFFNSSFSIRVFQFEFFNSSFSIRVFQFEFFNLRFSIRVY